MSAPTGGFRDQFDATAGPPGAPCGSSCPDLRQHRPDATDEFCAPVRCPFFGGTELAGKIECAVDQSDVAVCLGKFPNIRPVCGSISSASSPTSLHRAS